MAPVDDFGTEVLKKSAEEVTPGDKSNYYIKFKSTTGANASASTSTISRVGAASSNTSLVAANASRIQIILFNDSNKSAFVKYGTSASSTSFSIKMPPESHHFIDGPVYSGAIDAIWESGATGAMQITEM